MERQAIKIIVPLWKMYHRKLKINKRKWKISEQRRKNVLGLGTMINFNNSRGI